MQTSELGPALARAIRTPARRRFSAEPVASELVAEIVEAARWTGSARNRQPWRFVELRSRAVIEQIAGLGAYAQFVASAPVALVVASAENGFADTEYDVGRVTQSLVLAATAAGLACCPATLFPADNVATAARLLGLPDGWSPRHVLALGHPAPRARSAPAATSAVPTGRLSVAELLTTL